MYKTRGAQNRHAFSRLKYARYGAALCFLREKGLEPPDIFMMDASKEGGEQEKDNVVRKEERI